jgi:predicted small lipoprotein YifL
VTRHHTLFRRLLSPAAFAAALFVAGCGIKGPLELPEGSNVAANEGKGRFVSSPKATLPGYYQPSNKEKKAQGQLGNPTKPDEPFVLDPLLN